MQATHLGDKLQHIQVVKPHADTPADGLEQIVRYLSRLELSEGHLILFETRTDIPWEQRISREEELVDGKRAMVWGM